MQKIDAEKVQKYQDAINEAIKIHTKKATESLPYNKSELVEIVDITERNLGKYIVWNGSTRYYAYSENTTYDIGMKVYVNIPNSDFAAQKTIIGQYVAEGEKSVVWINPLDAFQPLPDINLLEDPSIGDYENKEYSLLANWNKENSFPEDKNEFPRSQEKVLFDSEGEITSEYQGHTYLGITADFKTRLETFSPIDGDYGLRLELRYRDKVSVLQDEVEKTRLYTLSAKNDMIGNVYNFRTYFTQASLFDISDIENITGMKLSFFQDGDFRRNTNKWIPVYYSLGQEGTDNYREYLLQDNIFVKDIKINVGDDLISKNDRIKIKTLQGLTYSTTQNDALNYKNIELEWDHLNPDSDKFEILDKDSADEKIVNYKIHWYRDAVMTASEPVNIAESEIELDKTIWNNFIDNPTKDNFDLVKETYHINNLIQVADYSIDNNIVTLTAAGEDKMRLGVEKALEPSKKRQDSSTQIDNLAGKGWQSLGEGKNFNYNYFLPDIKKSYSKIMAIVEYNINSNTFDTSDPNYVVVKSNVLEFTNEAMTSNPLSDDKNSALQITCEDGSNGDYPIYSGITGQLLSRTDVSLVRNFKATCKSLYDGSNYLTGDETIIWQIPKINTMIVINDSFIEDGAQLLSESPNEEIEYDDNYYFIARSVNDGIRPVLSAQQYQIAQFFNKACVNNTIYCYIIKNNEVFKASRTLTFNQHGTSGTDYTFTLGFKQKVDNNWNVVGSADTALTIGDINYLEIDFRLFNSKNEEIELTDEQKNAIILLWIDRVTPINDKGYYSGRENARDGLFFITQTNDNNQNIRIAVRVNPTASEDKLKHIVLQATVDANVLDNNLGKIQFTQLLPIHIRAEGTNYVLNGSDYIIYDDKGANTSFYNDKYELIGVSGGVEFEIKWNPDTNESSFYPFFDGEKLVPTPLYINDIGNEIWIDCYQYIIILKDGEQITEKKLLYTFPLIILQNKYQIPAINQWNGELVVDSSGNKVLAAMVGAGHKNPDNTFSGVLMGDIEKDDQKDTGLFGYDNGAQTFGFNVDGHAFIGASGNGRIYIDGNTGRIISAAREAYENNIENNQIDSDPRGTDINLKDNYIDIQGIGNQSRVHLDTVAGNGKAYLSVDNNNGNRLLHVGNDNYYLQTDNYNDINKTGLKIDLKNGVFNSYDKLTINGGLGSEIYFGETNNYIKLGLNNTGSYFNMYKKAGNPNTAANNLDNGWADLITAWNQIHFEDNLVPERETNGRITSNGYGKITNESDLNERISILNDSISDLYAAKEDAETDLNDAYNELAEATREFDAAKFNYDIAAENYEEALIIYNTSIEDFINIEQQARKAYDGTGGENGERGAVGEREDAEENYNTLLDERQRVNREVQWLIDNIDDLDRQISEIESLLTDPDLLPEQKQSLEDQLFNLQEQKEEAEIALTPKQTALQEIENNLILANNRLLAAIEAEENALSAWLNAQDAISNQQSYKEQALNTLVEVGPTFLPKNSWCYNFDGTQYQLLVDGELLVIKNEKENIINNEVNGKQKNYNDKLQIYNNAISAYNSEVSKLNNIKNKLENYLNLYRIYVNNVNNTGDGFININNTDEKRLEIGSGFNVTDKGILNATGATINGTIEANDGYLDNVTVKTLNFEGAWTDSNGRDHTDVTGIVPQWLTFVTDISGVVKRGTVQVTAKVSDTVYAPYTYTTQKVSVGKAYVDVYEKTASLGENFGYSNSNLNGEPTNKIKVEVGRNSAGQRYGAVQVNDVVVTNQTKTVNVKVPYKATIEGKTTVPVVTSINLTVQKVSMWALTNEDITSSTVVIN